MKSPLLWLPPPPGFSRAGRYPGEPDSNNKSLHNGPGSHRVAFHAQGGEYAGKSHRTLRGPSPASQKQSEVGKETEGLQGNPPPRSAAGESVLGQMQRLGQKALGQISGESESRHNFVIHAATPSAPPRWRGCVSDKGAVEMLTIDSLEQGSAGLFKTPLLSVLPDS